jgi:hypothetical protein
MPTSVLEAIAELKAAFLDIVPPAGVDLNDRVYAWPADRASISYETFPFIICAQVLNEAGTWRPRSQGGGFHVWPAEVLICLANWTSRDDISADIEAASPDWLLAAATVIFGNQGLGGTALYLGITDALFTSQIGNLGWMSFGTFWGVYLKVTVTQEQSLPAI